MSRTPDAPQPGHGRNGAEAFGGARKVEIAHQKLKHGDRCPECGKGNVYGQKEPKVLVRIVGQAPLAATVYSLERLRCSACGQVFTAQEPEGVGPEKYDETAAAMIAQLKYGSGVPFYRLERLESQLGIPLPAATQWEIVEEAAELIKPAYEELIRQAAQGEVVHNDDTSMRVLKLDARARQTSAPACSPAGSCRPARAGRSRCTSPAPACRREPRRRVEAAGGGACRRRFRCATRCRATCRSCPREWRFCWPTASLMEDGSSWKWRRTFPSECRYVLEMLGEVYGHDAEARERAHDAGTAAALSSAAQRPVMEQTAWLAGSAVCRAQDGAELRAGQGDHVPAAITGEPLTLFLREAGAPLDNNLVERALKRAILAPQELRCSIGR